MSAVGKILGLMIAGKGLADTTPLFNRLLSGIAAVVALAMLSAILAGVLVVGLIYVAYMALVQHGLDSDAAMFLMGGVVMVMVAILVSQLLGTIRRIKYIPAQVLARQNPLAKRATTLGYAFIDGFMNQNAVQPK